LKLYKDKSFNYEPFHNSLQNISRDTEGNSYPALNYSADQGGNNLIEKYSYILQSINSFEKQLAAAESFESISKVFKLALKRILPIKDANLFFFDDLKSKLMPFDSDFENQFTSSVNEVLKEGILEWIFENGKPTVIPEVNNYSVSGSKLNMIFYPILEDGKRSGVLAILTSIAKIDFKEPESLFIQIILDAGLEKIEKVKLKEKLNSIYNELQTYQAKLTNDFRLSAIGELTEGIVEDIKSPLQVILSYADLLSRESSDQDAANVVKEQVKKINYLVNRLVKFSSVNEEKIKIYPCDINHIIIEYYNLIKSSLDNVNIETVLDFEKDIPSILSHPSYVFQLLSNLISLIKSNSTDGGGIIIQTRCVEENIVVKFINTAPILPYQMENGAINRSPNLNFKIIENLMKQHEGEFSVESFQKNSSVIILKFPIRRKIRQ
jgi:K+-sensing histidine kinase KdpD